MRKGLISVYIIAILVFSIYGCGQTAEDTPAAETATVGTENTENEDAGDAVVEIAESVNEEQADSITDAVEQEEQTPDSPSPQEEHEPEKERNIDTEQVISDFLQMDAVEFQEKYDRDDLYQRGILYCGQEAWKTHIDYVEEFQQYTLENITAIRFYKEQPVPIYLDMNIGDRADQYEEEISICYASDYAVTIYSKPTEDGLSYIQEISFVKIESYLNRAPLNLYDFMEINYYQVLERLVDETWILSPDGDKAACVSNGGLPKYASQVYVWQGDDKPFTVFREEWELEIVGWIDNDHFAYYKRHMSPPVLVHLERNEIEKITEERKFDTDGVKYSIQGSDLIAIDYEGEQIYQWKILEKDGEIYMLEPD